MPIPSRRKQRRLAQAPLGLLVTIIVVSAISALHAANSAGPRVPVHAVRTASEAAAALVTIESSRGVGAGVIVGSHGYIVTTYHVVYGPGGGMRAASRYTVTLPSGTTRTATIAGSNVAADLVILQIPTSGLGVLPPADRFSGRLVGGGTGQHISAFCLSCSTWLNAVIRPPETADESTHRLRVQRAS